MELFFVVLYEKINKVSIEEFCLIQKIFLLNQLVLGSK